MYTLKMSERLHNIAKKNNNATKSNFKVASIVLDRDNNEHKGINIEYEIPTNSICAERNAISTALSNGMKMGDLKEVHILAITKEKNEFTPPCGLCRQAIYEASNGNADVYLYNIDNEMKKYTIKDLLPLPFEGPEK